VRGNGGGAGGAEYVPKFRVIEAGGAGICSGSLGKVGNCQIGVSVLAVTDWASGAIDWRLFMPKSWDDTTTDAE
jgi:hypothetical protein